MGSYGKIQRNVYFVKSIVFMRCGGELDRDVLYYNSPNLLFLKVYLLIFFYIGHVSPSTDKRKLDPNPD